MVDQFREYLQYQPFHIKTNNNPLTYVMSSPNLDAMGHRWVAALANFNMSLEYQKGSDNKVADCLSWVTERLDKDSVKELMQWAKAGGEASCAEADDPRVVQKDECLDNEVILQAKSMIARKVVFKNVADKTLDQGPEGWSGTASHPGLVNPGLKGTTKPCRATWTDEYLTQTGWLTATDRRISSWGESWCTWRWMPLVLRTGS